MCGRMALLPCAAQNIIVQKLNSPETCWRRNFILDKQGRATQDKTPQGIYPLRINRALRRARQIVRYPKPHGIL